MGKGKKSKKDLRDEEVDSDNETKVIKPTAEDNESDDEKVEKTKSNKKKDKKSKLNKKGRTSDDEEDDDSDIEKLTKNIRKVNIKSKAKKSVSDDDEDDIADEEIDKKPVSKKSKQKQKLGGFALLNVESPEISDDDIVDDHKSEDEDVVETKSKSKKPVKKQDSYEDDSKPVSTGGKKAKKSKKKRNDSDEDIDKVLAELEMEYAGIKVESSQTEKVDSSSKPDKQKKSKKENEEPEDGDDVDDDEEGGTVKTAAQKKKEKKERQKREAALLKQQAKELGVSEAELKKEKEPPKKPKVEPVVEPEKVVPEESVEPAAEESDKKKKKKDKSKPVVEEKKDEKSRKGPSKSAVAAMQEQLRKIKEEEERQEREEEERIQRMEEAENQRLEQLRLEQEKKDKKKQKERERKERLKAEGKLLSNKQKQDKMRALEMLEALKAQGVDVPDPGEKRPRPGTRVRTKRKDQVSQQTDEPKKDDQSPDNSENLETTSEAKVEPEVVEVKVEVIKEAWDVSSSSEEEEEESQSNAKPEEKEVTPKAAETKKSEPVKKQKSAEKSGTESSSDAESSEDEDGDDDEDGNDESSSDNEENRHLDAERRKQRVRERIDKRKHEAEKKRTTDNLRAAVVCVLGHVDTGKTKILDKLRRTHVQDGEAGGITQQIGATNVPIDAIKEQTKIVKNIADMKFKLPGLLIIDTPGHESFSNLRNRGSSLCDIAILVVDIMHGLEPQTIESLNLLKQRKTPFLVALNKIDRLYDWKTLNKKDIRDIIRQQESNTQLEFTKRAKDVILQFAEQGLNAALFYENPDPRSYVSLVPTSAITGEGMGNLLYLIVEACQTHLAKRLMFSEDLLATVLEVKAIPGLGTTIDAILINGKLREGDTMIVAGTEGPIVTQIRSLLMPQPMKELRVKNAYIEYKEIIAAQGVKIAAKELEKAIAGLNLQIAQKPDEVEIFREEVARELKSALSSIKLSQLGVYVQASTLGSLEALLEFLKGSKIPYCGIRIGPVVKRDVMKASTMLEHEPQFATILAFDVKIERDAQDLADNLGVKIFQADIIYHLFDKFMAYRDELKQKKRDEFKSIAVFPCKLKILPQFIFNSRDPIVMGVMVEAGIVKEGTPICVPTKEFVELGIITSIELNHKQIETARKGQEVCIKIEPIPGEAPKMFGRHFEETDMLVSKISRQSIDACKDYFRDDLIKADWALMVDLKKQFQIL